MGFELRAHTADVAVAASGDTLESVFAAVADGLAAAMCDDVPPPDETSETAGDDSTPEARVSLSVTAENREALLFDYLDELIYLRDVRGELLVDNRVERVERVADERDGAGSDGADGKGAGGDASWTLEASARGVPLAEIDARDVKAVTYSEMRLEAVDGKWEAYVVFDV
ncbi:archease [Natrialbaceae archaeon GCM10025810]|uniref:archease n=1 Tax=Halovalidus salilacus TaxID=3075124 RepID=UPI0036146886